MKCRLAVLAAAGLLLAACAGDGSPQPSGDSPLRVVATTTIVADLVRSVGGERVEVESLMGAGVDPHLYKPSAGDVQRLARAQAVFYSGLHLEGKMTEVLAEMGRRRVPTVAVAEAVPEDRLIEVEGFSGLHDPHVWFDAGLWALAAEQVEQALAEIDPEGASAYRARGDRYRQTLIVLDDWIRQRLAEVPQPQRVLVTAHDAFAYFGRAYGVEVRGLLGVSTADEAGIGDVQRLADFIFSRRLPAVFVESSVPLRYVEALQEAVAARGFSVAIGGTLYSDALGSPGTPAATYEGCVRANVETIVAALSGDGSQS